jgi:hypothetical protein
MLNLNGVDKSTLPCHVSTNDKGELVKWWACPSINEWAKYNGIKVSGWVIEIAGRDSYVLTDGKGVIYESPRLEDVAVHIDIMKLNLTM